MFKTLWLCCALAVGCLGQPAAVGHHSGSQQSASPGSYPTKRVLASWYGSYYHGKPTANGEVYNMFEYTAASKTLPFNSKLHVCYQSCTTVRINDRGPYVGGRSLDLSFAAAQQIGMIDAGVAPITMRRLS